MNLTPPGVSAFDWVAYCPRGSDLAGAGVDLRIGVDVAHPLDVHHQHLVPCVLAGGRRPYDWRSHLRCEHHHQSTRQSWTVTETKPLHLVGQS